MAAQDNPPALVRALTQVVSGAVQVQDFMRVVVTGAVEDTLMAVAADHGLDYSQLVARHRDALVARHTGGCSDNLTCRGLNARGNRCGKRAVVNGMCQAHAEQECEEQSKRRRLEAYKHRVASASTMDAVSRAVHDVTRSSMAPPPCPVGVSCSPLDLL